VLVLVLLLVLLLLLVLVLVLVLVLLLLLGFLWWLPDSILSHQPHYQSATRVVPESIPRPDYANDIQGNHR
jgi:hypothetical protein